MVDCGADWLNRLDRIAPTAIVLTHAHPDHAGGLVKGAPCPVYATKQTWDLLHRLPVSDRRRLRLRKSTTINGVRFTAFPVEHSIRAPAVGYRVSAPGQGGFFYLPDVAAFPNASGALRGIEIYIGDGATIKRSMVSRREGVRIGHAPIIAQLGWCRRTGVGFAIFTHCGSPITRGDARRLDASVRRIGRQYGVEARIACDGDQLCFPDRALRRRPTRVKRRA
jgi:phosphoribosyl 1,2-cyclic phosphodiesterase